MVVVSDFFLGEIRMFPFDWAPVDWALCNGAILQITQNQALYSLLGTQFGGDGAKTFGLPDLQGRVPLCAGYSANYGTYYQGNRSMGGVENVTLAAAQAPIHTHSFKALSAQGSASTPANGALVSSAKPVGTTVPSLYGAVAASPVPTMAPLNSGTLNSVGGAAHNNMQPFTVLNFCISTLGLYPSRP